MFYKQDKPNMAFLYWLTAHSLFRWLVLVALFFTTGWSFRGYVLQKTFTKTGDAIRHWTATILHIQLILGLVVYGQSPMAKYYLSHPTEFGGEPAFFGLLHMVVMAMAVCLVTLGSARAKRKPTDREKYTTILFWYGLALLLILLAIPWPFSPLAQRPCLRLV